MPTSQSTVTPHVHTGLMTTKFTDSPRPEQPQLLLISGDQENTNTRWSLDDETRETGRRGLAKARAALQATRPRHLDVAA